jgi:hypothetical protein
MNEGHLLRAVVDLAHLHGCLVHHQRPARTATGWRSAIQGDPGWPDVVIAGPRGLLVRELKTGSARASLDQVAWLSILVRGGVDVAVWRPEDLRSGRIVAEIRGVGR